MTCIVAQSKRICNTWHTTNSIAVCRTILTRRAQPCSAMLQTVSDADTSTGECGSSSLQSLNARSQNAMQGLKRQRKVTLDNRKQTANSQGTPREQTWPLAALACTVKGTGPSEDSTSSHSRPANLSCFVAMLVTNDDACCTARQHHTAFTESCPITA